MAMRLRLTGLVAIGLGVFLLVLAALLRFYAVPTLEKIPSDEWSQQIATGTGTALNASTGIAEPNVQITQDQTIRGEDPQPGGRPAHSVVWDAATSLYFTTANQCPKFTPAQCPISFTQETVALDDHTSQAISTWSGDQIAPGAPDGTALHHAGYIWKLPFHVQKQDYPFYDPQTGKAYPAKYVGTAIVQSPVSKAKMRAYKFVQDLGSRQVSTRTDVPPSLIGELGALGTPIPEWYDRDITTIWVDPTSGLILAGTQDVKISLHSLDGTQPRLTILDAKLTLDQLQQTNDNDKPVFAKDASGKDQPVFENYTEKAIHDANRIDRITLLRNTVPLYGGILGLLLLIGGLVLAWPGRAANAASTKDPDDYDGYADYGRNEDTEETSRLPRLPGQSAEE
jgi:hypothetical protein